MSGVWVFVGGGLGAVLRWVLTDLGPSPWSTVAINVAGSLLLAMLAHPGTGAGSDVRLALGVGVLGGFTTYSTFNLQLLDALQRKEHGTAALLVGLTLAGSLGASAIGWWLAGEIARARAA